MVCGAMPPAAVKLITLLASRSIVSLFGWSMKRCSSGLLRCLGLSGSAEYWGRLCSAVNTDSVPDDGSSVDRWLGSRSIRGSL